VRIPEPLLPYKRTAFRGDSMGGIYFYSTSVETVRRMVSAAARVAGKRQAAPARFEPQSLKGVYTPAELKMPFQSSFSLVGSLCSLAFISFTTKLPKLDLISTRNAVKI
jgi:hypothetical protein